MAKEAQYVPCHCKQCNGREIDQANWLLHNGRVTSGMSWVAQEIKAMGQRFKEEGR